MRLMARSLWLTSIPFTLSQMAINSKDQPSFWLIKSYTFGIYAAVETGSIDEFDAKVADLVGRRLSVDDHVVITGIRCLPAQLSRRIVCGDALRR